jgi:hypothetical protein
LGEISNGTYVPYVDIKKKPDSIKEYAASALVSILTRDIFIDITNKLGETGMAIYLAALMMFINNNQNITEIKDQYDSSYASEVYRSHKLSKNSMCEMIELMGRKRELFDEFLEKRILFDNLKLIIDGTQIFHDSNEDAFAEFGHNHYHKPVLQKLNLVYL